MNERTFRQLVGTNFIRSLTLSLTGMIDCAVAGRYLGENGLSAMKIAMPVFTIICIFSIIMASGQSITISRELSSGNKGRANRIVNSIITAALILSSLFMLTGIFLSGQLARLLAGPDCSEEVLGQTAEYLVPILLAAFPIMAHDILGYLVMLEGNRRCMAISSVVIFIIDVGGDVLAVISGAGMAGIAAASALAYLGAFITVLFHFLGKKSMFRIRIIKPDMGLLLRTAVYGLPMGVNSICNIIWPLSVNRMMLKYGSVTGLAALSIQDAVHYVPKAFCAGVSSAVLIMTGINSSEKDRSGLENEKGMILRSGILAGGGIALILALAARPLIGLFTTSPVLQDEAVLALRLYLICVPFMALNYSVVSYFQGLGHHGFASGYVFASHTVIAVLCCWLMGMRYGSTGIYGSFAACEIITAALFGLIQILCLGRVNRSRDFLYGSSDMRTELRLKIRNISEATAASKQIFDLCMEEGIDPRKSHHLALCAEELAVNSIEHGFRDGRKHELELRLMILKDSLIMRLRDDCRHFDLVERYGMIETEDPTKNIGLKIIFRTAGEVSYSSSLSMNNICIRMDL